MAAEKSEAIQGLGRLDDLKGSKARAEKIMSEEGSEATRRAAKARWDKKQWEEGGIDG